MTMEGEQIQLLRDAYLVVEELSNIGPVLRLRIQQEMLVFQLVKTLLF